MLLPKPVRGSHVIDREIKRKALRKLEDDAKAVAKLRDGYRCRWPEKHVCRGLLEGAHIFEDKKMGGDHGRLSESAQLMTLCGWLHRRGPISIHGKTAKVEPETDRGADAACAFYTRPSILDEWTCVGVEVAIGVLRKD